MNSQTRNSTRRRASLLGGILLVCLGSVTSLRAGRILRLGDEVVPTFEAIRLEVDAGREDYRGSVRIDLKVRRATSTFKFHAEGQSIARLDLKDGSETIGVETTSGEDGLITVRTQQPLAPGSYVLAIDFTNTFNTRAVGLYRVMVDGVGYLFTQFESIDARKAFPCWDEPGFKIPYQLTLVVPEAHTAVSNTPIERETVTDGRRTIAFHETKPIPSYLLAIASGPLESVEIKGMKVPGHVYTVKGQSHLAGLAVEVIPPVFAALERYFQQPYPYRKLDVIAVPEYWFGGMENAGAIVCDDAAILVDRAAASVPQKRRLVGLMAHEIAHMWFGDLVTMTWWDDLWLNESFATYAGERITHELYPEYKVDLARRQSVQNLMAADARPSTKPIRKTIESTNSIFEDLRMNYGKGRAVLGMIEQMIGPEAFRAGVMDYLGEHAWGNAVAADLWSALGKASKQDISGPMSSFLDQSGLPLVDVSVEANGSINLSQRRFLNEGVEAEDRTWKIPMRLRYFDDESVKTTSVMLDTKDKTIALGARVSWVFPDDGGNGYYRWNLPSGMLQDMAEHSADRLDPPERIVFLGNAAALLDAGRITGGDYLGILASFSDDSEPQVVSAVLSGLEKVKESFVTDELRPAFAAYVRQTVRPMLDRFGMQTSDGEDETVTMLRPRLLGWLGDEGEDAEVRRHALKMSKAYMADPSSVDPALAATALHLAAIEGDRALYEEYRKRYETARTPAERQGYLRALGAFEDPEIREDALSYALSGQVRPDELMRIPSAMVKTEKDADMRFRWVTEHYEDLRSRIPTMRLAQVPFSAGGCSMDRLEEARRFFDDPAHQVDGTGSTMSKVADEVTDCVKLREREGTAIATYLKRLGTQGGGAGSHGPSSQSPR